MSLRNLPEPIYHDVMHALALVIQGSEKAADEIAPPENVEVRAVIARLIEDGHEESKRYAREAYEYAAEMFRRDAH